VDDNIHSERATFTDNPPKHEALATFYREMYNGTRLLIRSTLQLRRRKVDWFKSNAEWIGVIVAILLVAIPLGITGWRYVEVRRSEERQRRFENYHGLIRRLVSGYPDEKVPMIDCQIAVVYELRNYEEYSEVSTRILEGLKQKWEKEHGSEDKMKGLLNEISITIQKLKRC
jgi:hypothetical protein